MKYILLLVIHYKIQLDKQYMHVFHYYYYIYQQHMTRSIWMTKRLL